MDQQWVDLKKRLIYDRIVKVIEGQTKIKFFFNRFFGKNLLSSRRTDNDVAAGTDRCTVIQDENCATEIIGDLR